MFFRDAENSLESVSAQPRTEDKEPSHTLSSTKSHSEKVAFSNASAETIRRHSRATARQDGTYLIQHPRQAAKATQEILLYHCTVDWSR